MSKYHNALEKVLDEAKPVEGYSREELESGIADISKQLRGSLGNAERILLCGDRESLRKALNALPK